jgi:two-component system LytT family sensor kinase
MRSILLADRRSVSDRLEIALIFAFLFGAGETARILTSNQYQAIDLALESALIAGLIAGYISGLVTGICVSIPAMFAGEYMSMPLFAAAGVMGGLLRDIAPDEEDVWYFSAFVDLNVYRVVRDFVRRRKTVLDRRVVERSAFNVACNLAVLVIELVRMAQAMSFRPAAFSIIKGWSGPVLVHFIAMSVTTLFSVSIPIRIWSSVRTEEKLKAQQTMLVEARLAALTNQINPHFLFNTLNSVATLIRIDPEKARGVVYRLSNILRRLLRKTENFSPLRDEIRFIDDYLAIEMVRFGDKLRFVKDVSDDSLDRLVPSMILQPLIENSIKHGLASKVEGGTILLRVWLDSGTLHILVEDDGVGMEEGRLMSLLDLGIGVSNVNERLNVLFASKYRLQVESSPGKGTRTLIQLPDGFGESRLQWNTAAVAER